MTRRVVRSRRVISYLPGWPLEWTEIVVTFMPILFPLLGHFEIDPLSSGLLVALNPETAHLSPPAARAGSCPKGLAPSCATLGLTVAVPEARCP